MQSQTNPTLPNPAKRSFLSFVLVPAVVLALLVAASYVGIKWMQTGDVGKLIFHQTNFGWQHLPAPGGYPESIRVSSRGVAWVRIWGRDRPSRWGGLSWWDGAKWNYHRADHKETDPAARNSWWESSFALDGDEVWAPTEQGVQHWDGKQLEAYPEAPASEGASTVAGDGQV